MATSVIRSSVVSTSAGRRNICDCLAQESVGLGKSLPKSKSADQLTDLTCACLRCQYLSKDLQDSQKELPVEHRHRPVSPVLGSLGALSAKESPIFVRRQIWFPPQESHLRPPLSSSQFSLRSAAPAYAESQPELDLGAVEALQLTSAMPVGTNRTHMDINRNNGYLHNGVSTNGNTMGRSCLRTAHVKISTSFGVTFKEGGVNISFCREFKVNLFNIFFK